MKRAQPGGRFWGKTLLPAILPGVLVALAVVGVGCADSGEGTKESASASEAREFQVTGVIRNLRSDGRSAIIEHEEIPGYMDAMTMPFQVRETNLFAGVAAGDEIRFRLNVTEETSWIDRIERTGRTEAVAEPAVPPEPDPNAVPVVPPSRHPLRDFPFNNELNRVTRISDFEGRAVGITFFFTRCPIPDYCPRLTKNFEAASRKLASLPDAPTNWHFLSVTIDPEFDTPAVLRAYGRRYQYDPSHWSFLTGPKKELTDLAEQSGVSSGWEGNLLNHNFRTLIIDATGKLQMSFPTGGDLSDAIVLEIIKAAQASRSGQ